MRFYSTVQKDKRFTLRDVVLMGLAPDGGLFMPETIPALSSEFWKQLPKWRFTDLAYWMAEPFLKADFTPEQIRRLVEESFPFEAPLKALDNNLFVLELFHGPTLAFKDFGAQFMARLVEWIAQQEERPLTVLVATSGDTGSAVAHGFYRKQGVQVVLLYPSGKVSEIQEKQLTTLGHNVIALEVEGTFDDCQKLVKQAFNDSLLKQTMRLTSANSINFARLLPQSFYYAYALAQLPKRHAPVVISVPSGNLGNLTGGLLAQRMGLPVWRFVSAMNANDVFFHYLQTGRFTPRPAQPTISNAMDVGNPSNLQRILDLFEHQHERVRQVIYGAHFSDEQTRKAIRQAYQNYGYLFDPHGAVGLLGIEQFAQEMHPQTVTKIVLETAHPAKFKDIVEDSCGVKVPLPERLAQTLTKPKSSVKMPANFAWFKEWLLSLKQGASGL